MLKGPSSCPTSTVQMRRRSALGCCTTCDVADNHTAQPAWNGFDMVHTFHFQPGGGQDLGGLLDIHVVWEQSLSQLAEIFMGCG